MIPQINDQSPIPQTKLLVCLMFVRPYFLMIWMLELRNKEYKVNLICN